MECPPFELFEAEVRGRDLSGLPRPSARGLVVLAMALLLSSAAHAEERPSPGDRAADLRALCEAHRRAGQPGIGRGAIERSRQSASGGAEQAGDGTSTDPESEALAARLDEALRQLRGLAQQALGS